MNINFKYSVRLASYIYGKLVMTNPVDVLDDLDSYLARLGDEEAIAIDLDACIECKSASPPLVSAISNGHKECMKEILRAQELDMNLSNIRCESGATLAHIAARKGDSEVLELLLRTDQALLDIGDVRGATPLHVCAYHGHLDCLSRLLEIGASADQKDFDGATPLHFAAASGHLDCLKKLIKKGNGSATAQTNSGETPVYFAAQEGHLDCVQWLIGHAATDPLLASNDGMTPLHAASQTGRLNVTHWLVRSAHCPITCRTSDGATPVHFAAAKGHVAILEWLLHHSLATGLEQDDFGATPVHDAAEQGQLECLHVFYNHHVDLGRKDFDGFTPKDLAEERGNKQCMAFLEDPEKVSREERNAGTKGMNAGLLVGLEESPPKVKKKRTFSFLSKIKGGSHGNR